MSPRWKITAILIAIVLASGWAGGFAGFQFGKAKYRKRSNPEAWNVDVMGRLDRDLKLTPEQHSRVQAVIDGGVEEFKAIRIDTIAKSDAVLQRMVAAVDKELTPEQRVVFQEKVKNQRVQASLDMLKVEPRKKP